ncbi:hypothetical protein GE21DRAFT_1274261 [Neurospora crassa]|nr:hypothetical protein GE21DRAFT_1274261 [Neurospora crassa]
MDHRKAVTSTSASPAGTPTRTLLEPSPPETRDPRTRSRSEPKFNASRTRSTSTKYYLSLPGSAIRQGYLDYLVPPTNTEFDHITTIQAERETKRKQLELRRRCFEQQAQLRSKFLQPPQDHNNPSAPISSRRSGAFSIADRLGLTRQRADSSTSVRTNAAALVQRTYRDSRAPRQLRGLSGLGPFYDMEARSA